MTRQRFIGVFAACAVALAPAPADARDRRVGAQPTTRTAKPHTPKPMHTCKLPAPDDTSARGALEAAKCARGHGDAVDAWMLYRTAARRATSEGAHAVATSARAAMQQLEARVGRVRISGREVREVDGLVVRVDGRTVPLDEDVAIAPGSHRIQGSAPDALPWIADIEVTPGTLSIVVALPPAAGPPPPPAQAPVSTRNQNAEAADSSVSTAARSRDEVSDAPASRSDVDANAPRWKVSSDLAIARVSQGGIPGGVAIMTLGLAYAPTHRWTVSIRESMAYTRPIGAGPALIPANPVLGGAYAIALSRLVMLTPKLEVALPVGGAAGDSASADATAGRSYSMFVEPSFDTNFFTAAAGVDCGVAFGRFATGVTTELRQAVRTRGAAVEPDSARTQLVEVARASVLVGDRFVPYVAGAYVRMLSDSALLKIPGMQDIFLFVVGTKVLVGSATIGLAYQRPLSGPGLALNLHILSGGIEFKL